MTITLDQFFARQFIGKPEAQAFKEWLGSLADSHLAEKWWMQLWREFLEEQG